MKEKKFALGVLIVYFFLSIGARAQFKSAIIGVDGLTCSACSFSTEKSLLKLTEIDSVFMQLEENTATVFFKPGKKINMNDVAKKVVDAGFSVRSFSALIDVDQLKVNPDSCWFYENDVYHFIKTDKKELHGIVIFQFIGEKFMSAREFKKWKLYRKNLCAVTIPNAPYSTDYYVSVP